MDPQRRPAWSPFFNTECTVVVHSRPTLELTMPYSRKVVLNCPRGYRMELEPLVEEFVRDGVKFVGVVGEDCATVEDHVDWIVVGDGSDDSRFILTSSHPGETVTEALEFARSLTGDYEGEVQLVEL